MTVLLEWIWPALAASFSLGALLSGALGGGHAGLSARRSTQAVAILAVMVLVGVAATQVVPGRAGLWLDIGAACLAAYAAGSVLGSLARRLVKGKAQAETAR